METEEGERGSRSLGDVHDDDDSDSEKDFVPVKVMMSGEAPDGFGNSADGRDNGVLYYTLLIVEALTL